MSWPKLGICVMPLLVGACGSDIGSPGNDCATGGYLEGSEIRTCFESGTLSLPLSGEAKELLEGTLGGLGLDRVSLGSEYYVLPRSVAPTPNARALYKPRVGSSGRVPIIEIAEGFDQAADDGALVLAILHEYGHIAQYLRGEPAGDQLPARLCADVGAADCEGRILDHLKAMERDADAFMVNSIRAWTPAQVAALDFDPWALIDLIEVSPVGPAYPPTPERVTPIASALEGVGLTRGVAPRSTRRLAQLAQYGALSQQAIDRQGGVPR